MDNNTLLNAFYLESLDAGTDKLPEKLASYKELLARLDLLDWFLKNIYIAPGMMEMKKCAPHNVPNPFRATYCNAIKIVDEEYDKYCDIARSIKNLGFVSDEILDTLKEKMPNKIAYLCDRKQCKGCSYPNCKHTLDIKHAKNFLLGFSTYYEKEEKKKLDEILEILKGKNEKE